VAPGHRGVARMACTGRAGGTAAGAALRRGPPPGVAGPDSGGAPCPPKVRAWLHDHNALLSLGGDPCPPEARAWAGDGRGAASSGQGECRGGTRRPRPVARRASRAGGFGRGGRGRGGGLAARRAPRMLRARGRGWGPSQGVRALAAVAAVRAGRPGPRMAGESSGQGGCREGVRGGPGLWPRRAGKTRVASRRGGGADRGRTRRGRRGSWAGGQLQTCSPCSRTAVLPMFPVAQRQTLAAAPARACGA
jgi:hypothetical protein